jgi:hypothetical protein
MKNEKERTEEILHHNTSFRILFSWGENMSMVLSAFLNGSGLAANRIF